VCWESAWGGIFKLWGMVVTELPLPKGLCNAGPMMCCRMQRGLTLSLRHENGNAPEGLACASADRLCSGAPPGMQITTLCLECGPVERAQS